jgi:hypothetical protein
MKNGETEVVQENIQNCLLLDEGNPGISTSNGRKNYCSNIFLNIFYSSIYGIKFSIIPDF